MFQFANMSTLVCASVVPWLGVLPIDQKVMISPKKGFSEQRMLKTKLCVSVDT